MTVQTDAIVVGGGIVGLSSAWALAKRGLAVVVLEKERTIAAHQTGHNSGVIHSGLYYKPGSYKASLAIRGRALLQTFCLEHGVPFELSGKIVVAAADEERPRLQALFERGKGHGLRVRELSPEAMRELEPSARGVAALFVPETGIVNFSKVATALEAEIARLGGAVLLGEKLASVKWSLGKYVLITERNTFVAKRVVTCAGLHADRVAEMFGAFPEMQIFPFRGEYYRVKREGLVRNLIYPVPDPRFPFLGVHLTRTMDHGTEAGPNAVLALAREGYTKRACSFGDLGRMLSYAGFWNMAIRYGGAGAHEVIRSISKSAFLRALQRLVPDLSHEDIEPGGAGIRAQAVAPDGTLFDDFWFEEGPGVLHVLNAPSPAATASLAIGETIANRLLAETA